MRLNRSCVSVAVLAFAVLALDTHALVESGEQASATLMLCGDGVFDAGEQCDDGNTQDGDGCSSACFVEQPDYVCSDPVTTTSAPLITNAVAQGSFEDERGRLTTAWRPSFLADSGNLLLCSEVLCPWLGQNVASDGAFAAVLRTTQQPAYEAFFQALFIPIGATQLSFELSVISCDSDQDELYVFIDGTQVWLRNCDALTAGFETVTVDITPFADDQVHEIELAGYTATGNVGGTLIAVDEVRIALPEPAAPIPGECRLLSQACAPVETFDRGIPNNWTVINLSPNPLEGWGTTEDGICLSRNASVVPSMYEHSDGDNVTTGFGTAACADSDATAQNADDLVPESATVMDTYLCSQSLDLTTITGPHYSFNANYQSKDNTLASNGSFNVVLNEADSGFLEVVAGTVPPSALTVGAYSVIYSIDDHEDASLTLTGAQEIELSLEGIIEAEPEGYVCFHYKGTGAWFAQIDNAALRGADCALAPVDTDGDGVFDSTDNCTLLPNPDQMDTNNDGIGNLCDPDVDNNCITAFLDFATFTPKFGSAVGDPLYDEDYDIDSNGSINFVDYFTYTSFFGQPPGPSANPCVPGLGT